MRIRTLALSVTTMLAPAIGLAIPVAADESTAALIQRQSQAFSDASASGDAATLSRYLDDRVTFMDESGALDTKHDIVASAGPPPPGYTQTLVQSDFHVRIHGDVAVTDFIDNSTVHVHGQVITPKFRSTEVWLKEPSGWRMISSQTIALPRDPPAVTLPVATLQDYVGTYAAGSVKLTIARNGNELTGSTNGGPTFPLRAEIKDVLFVPGQPRLRRLITRDANGTVTGIIRRSEGYDISLRRVA